MVQQQVPQVGAVPSAQQTNVDLLLDQRGEMGTDCWLVEQADESPQAVDQVGIDCLRRDGSVGITPR